MNSSLNASDALGGCRFRAIGGKRDCWRGSAAEVRIVPDPEAGTLTISDDGIEIVKKSSSPTLVQWLARERRSFTEKNQSCGRCASRGRRD